MQSSNKQALKWLAAGVAVVMLLVLGLVLKTTANVNQEIDQTGAEVRKQISGAGSAVIERIENANTAGALDGVKGEAEGVLRAGKNWIKSKTESNDDESK